MGSWFSDWKNLTIIVLALVVFTLGGILLKDRSPEETQTGKGTPTAGTASVLDIAFDRETQRGLNIIFDRPLGEDHIGEILGKDPAILKPTTGGSWKWQGANVLRFEATNRFAMSTEYHVALILERHARSSSHRFPASSARSSNRLRFSRGSSERSKNSSGWSP